MIRGKFQHYIQPLPYTLIVCFRMASSRTTLTLSGKLFEKGNVANVSGKRPTLAVVLSILEKVKGTVPIESQLPPFWLGFQAMNALANSQTCL